MESILIADDDTEFTELLIAYLAQQGFAAAAVADGRQALLQLAEQPGRFDALVLDIMMPVLNGLDALGELRAARHAAAGIPVIMLTARGDDIDRIVGLELGADDYLAKPANPRELVARLRAVLRRSASAEPLAEARQFITLGDLTIDLGRREALLGDKLLPLTDSELLLLIELTKSAGTIVSKEQLALAITGRSLGPYDRSVDMHLSNLRRKLDEGIAAASAAPLEGGRLSASQSPDNRQVGQRIKTVRNKGYQYLV